MHGIEAFTQAQRRTFVFIAPKAVQLSRTWQRKSRMSRYIIKAVKYLVDWSFGRRPSRLALTESESSTLCEQRRIENKPLHEKQPPAAMEGVGSQPASEPEKVHEEISHQEQLNDASEWNRSHRIFLVSCAALALVVISFWCLVVRRVRSLSLYVKELEMKLYLSENAMREEMRKMQVKDCQRLQREVEAAAEMKETEDKLCRAAEEAERERRLSLKLSVAFDRISRSHSAQMKLAQSKVDQVKVKALDGMGGLINSYKQGIDRLVSLCSSHALEHNREIKDLQLQLESSIQEIKRQRERGRQLESDLVRRAMEADDHIRELEDLAMKNNRATALLSTKEDQIKHDRQLRDTLQVSLQEAEERVQDLESELKALRTNLMIEAEASLRAQGYIATLTSEKEVLEAEAAKIPAYEEKIAQASDRMKALMGRLVVGEQQVQSLQQEIGDRDGEIKRLEESLVRVKAEGSEREKRLEAGWQKKAAESQALFEAKESEVKARVGDIEVLKAELLRCKEEILAHKISAGMKKGPLILRMNK
jgi:hypothetical protein